MLQKLKQSVIVLAVLILGSVTDSRSQDIHTQVTNMLLRAYQNIGTKYAIKPPEPHQVRTDSLYQVVIGMINLTKNVFDSSGLGYNISNHALSANGNYLQNWNGYNLRFSVLDTVEFSQMKRLYINDTSDVIIETFGDMLYLGRSTKSISLDRNTGAVMIDSAYYLPTTFGGGIGAVLQKTGTFTSAWNVITNISLITSYNGSGTAGNGLWVIRAHNRFKNRTSSITVTSYTPPFDSEYYISGYFNANSNTGDTYYYIDYTDQQGVLHTGEKLALLSTATMAVEINCFEIMAKGGTPITLYTTVSTGSIDYDISGTITQLSN